MRTAAPRKGASDRGARAATGPAGTQSWVYDGVGNRTSETTAGVVDTYTLPGTSNRLSTVTRNAQTIRQIGYDANGNINSDNRAGAIYTFTYNNANRLKTVTQSTLKGTYTSTGSSS